MPYDDTLALVQLARSASGVSEVPDAAFDDVVEFAGHGVLDWDPGHKAYSFAADRSPFVSQPYAVTLWARPTALQAPSGQPEVILSGIADIGGLWQGWQLVLDGRLKLFLGGFADRLSPRFSTDRADQWGTVDRWTHLAVVVQLAGSEPRIGLYVDGEKLLERTSSGSDPFKLWSSGKYRLGGPAAEQLTPACARFRGRIAKVRFRSGALDEAAIRKDRDDTLAANPRAQAHLDDALIVHVGGASLADGRSPDDSGNGRDMRLPAGSVCRVEQRRLGVFLPVRSEATIAAPAVGLKKGERQLCFTVTVWFHVPDASGDWQTLLRSATAAGAASPAWSLQVGQNAVRARLSWSSGPGSIPLPSPAGGWHFVALAVHTETDQGMVHASLHLDGQHTEVPAAGDFSLPDEVGLFAGDPTGTQPLGLADVRVVRRALSDDEIQQRRRDDLAGLPDPARYGDPTGDGVRAVYPLSAVTGVDKLADARGGDPAKLPGENFLAGDPAGACLPLSGGSTAALTLPAAFLDPHGGAQIGVSVWLRMLLHPSAEPVLFETAPAGTQQQAPEWTLGVSANRRLRLESRDSRDVLDLGPAPANGEWFHLALSLIWGEGQLRAALWLDGAPAGEATCTSSFDASGERQRLCLGNHQRNYTVLLEAAGLRVFDVAPQTAAVRAAMAEDAPPRLAAQRAVRSWLALTEPENEDGMAPLTDAVAAEAGSEAGSPSVVPDSWFHRCVSLGPEDRVRSSVGLPVAWQTAPPAHVAFWSVAVWVRPDADALSAGRTLWSTDRDPSGFQLRAVVSDGGDTLEIRGGDVQPLGERQPFAFKHRGAGLLRPDRWTHIALGFRLGADYRRLEARTRELCLFIDGTERPLERPNTAPLDYWHEDHRPRRSGDGWSGGWSPVKLALGDGSPSSAGSVRYADLRIAGRLPDAAQVGEWIRYAESINFATLEEANRGALADLPLDRLDNLLFEDASGYDHPGQVEEGTPVTVVDDRHMGRAADYSGSQAPATIHIEPIFRTASGRGITVEVWAKPFMPPAANPSPLIRGTRDGTEVWALLGGARAGLRCQGGGTVPGRAMARSQWQHLAVVLEEDAGAAAQPRTARLFLDGESLGSCEWNLGGGGPGSIEFGALAPGAGESWFEGRLANLRIFDRALGAAEIADAFAARKPGPVPASSHHLEFALHDSRRESALYLMDGAQPMVLDVTNASPAELSLPLLPGTPDPGEHHFELRFRAGVLRDLETITVTGPVLPGVAWKLVARDTPGADYAVSLFLTATGDAQGSLPLAAGASWSFALANVTPDPGGGTRSTRVQLRWRNCRSAQGEPLVGTRLHHLQLVHGSKPSAVSAFPLHARIVGAPLVPTGAGSTNAALEIEIVHDGELDLPMPASPDPELCPVVRVAFPGALTGSDHSPDFSLDDSSRHWRLSHAGGDAELRWQGDSGATDAVTDLGAVIDGVEELGSAAFGRLALTASGLDPDARTGTAWVVVRFENFPDLDNPHRTLPDIVQRVPVLRAPIALADELPATESLSVDGSLGLWQGSLRLHGAAWTAGSTDAPEGTIEWKPAQTGPPTRAAALEVRSSGPMVLQAANSRQLRFGLESDGGGSANLTELREPGDVKITAGGKATTFGANGKVTLPGPLEFGGLIESPNGITVRDERTGADAHGYPVPRGTIVMWYGQENEEVPTGWALCNGTKGTPDLRGNFVVAAAAIRGSTRHPGDYLVGDTGGAKTVKLNVDQMPAHSHPATVAADGEHAHTINYSSDNLHHSGSDSESNWQLTKQNRTATTDQAGRHTHGVTIGQSGGGQDHENRPPFYALCFIMKL